MVITINPENYESVTIVTDVGAEVTIKEWARIKKVVNNHFKKPATINDSVALVKSEFGVSDFMTVRQQYTVSQLNPFLKHFGKHQTQFYNTLCYRINKGHITEHSLHCAFSRMQLLTSFSIMDFLLNLVQTGIKYTNKEALVDFIYIMLDGKVSSVTAEKKGAVILQEWVESGKVSMTEIEDCFLWMPVSGRAYKLSLLSVVSALSEFDRVKVEKNGRFVGTSLVPNNAMVNRDRLESRNYSDIGTSVASAIDAKKKAINALTAGR